MSGNHGSFAHNSNAFHSLFEPLSHKLPVLKGKLPHALDEHLSVGTLILAHPFIVEPVSHFVTSCVQYGIDKVMGWPAKNPLENISRHFHLRFEAPKLKDTPAEISNSNESKPDEVKEVAKINVDLPSNNRFTAPNTAKFSGTTKI